MSNIRKAVRNPGKAFNIIGKNILRCLGNRNYRHFILLTRSRTGSNMLSSLLKNHPNIDVHGEIFSRLEGRDYKDILKEGFAKQPFYIKAAGFKIFYYHPLDDPSSVLWNDLVNMDGLHVVQLKRRNVLRSLVSSKIATRQNVWLSTRSDASKGVADRRVSLSSKELTEGFEATRKWISQAESMFSEHPMLTLYYEDLVVNSESNIKRAFDFLGVDYCPVSTVLKRQNPESLRDLISNFDELNETFRSTEWRSYFED